MSERRSCTCLQLMKIWPHTRAISSHIAFSALRTHTPYTSIHVSPYDVPHIPPHSHIPRTPPHTPHTPIYTPYTPTLSHSHTSLHFPTLSHTHTLSHSHTSPHSQCRMNVTKGREETAMNQLHQTTRASSATRKYQGSVKFPPDTRYFA